MKFSVTTIAFSLFNMYGSTVLGHSYLVEPVSRIDSSTPDMENVMGCPVDGPGESTSYSPGETIDVRYWRNNHLGGFIRWAMVPLGEETKENFDDNVFFYTCRESGPECVPNRENTRYASDGSGDFTISCGDTITLPDWLPEGDYVLQWTWHSVGSSFGNIGWMEPQFRSCADIHLTSDGDGEEPSCPTFVGGDRVTKLEGKGDDQCMYFYDNDIVSEQFKGSNDDFEQYYKFGIPAQVEQCGGGNSTENTSDEKPTDTEGSTGLSFDDDKDRDTANEAEGNEGEMDAETPSPSSKQPCRAK